MSEAGSPHRPHRPDGPLAGLTATVVTVSDRVSAGVYEDRSGPLLVAGLTAQGAAVTAAMVPDEVDRIVEAVRNALATGARLVLTTGGTGIGPRDVTPEAVAPLLDRQLPGIAEAIRTAGAATAPFAALSRGIAGTVGDALVVTLPGSTGGARDGLAVLTPLLPHALEQLRGGDHDASGRGSG